MKRKIITIDQNACNGCGLCVDACHESAIGLVNGKATLLRDDYCDGLGNCLPACPVNAITFEEREALPFNEEEVKKNAAKASSKTLTESPTSTLTAAPSRLNQWPIQIKLLPTNAPYFNDADLLIAADCTAYAYGDFHNTFIKNRITLIGCPKLDEGDYAQKLTEIFMNNEIKSITVVRMVVPCCGGIVNSVKTALRNSGKMIPWQVITISTDGTIIEM